MHIRAGYELIYRCPQATPMVVTLRIHESRAPDVIKPDDLLLSDRIALSVAGAPL